MEHRASVAEMALVMVPGIGDVMVKHLVSYFGSAEGVFRAQPGKLMKVPGIGEKTVQAIKTSQFFDQAASEIDQLAQHGAFPVFYTSPVYPNRLKRVMNAPPILYFKGTADLNSPKVVSIVGTRNATDYGRACIDQLLGELQAMPGLLVVSGLAYGIDIYAHRTCLRLQIPTVGVMANGMDRIYPNVHRQSAQLMTENGGGLLTEIKMGVKPEAHYFPERNRIIAGMADVVVVVEAAEKGGALITAEFANSFGVEVMAVPGNIINPYSAGCNQLIKNHKAHILTKAQDLIELMNWDISGEKSHKKGPHLIEDEAWGEEEKKVVALLRNGPMHIDELSYKSQIPLNRLASTLLALEFSGYVKPQPGKQFVLVAR
jgi:DNA processing protein